MATESAMKMVESGGVRNWPSSKDSEMLSSGLKNMAAEELGLLLDGRRFRGDQTDMIPSRSGSAPPSMEGSFAAMGNFIAKQNSGPNSSFENLSSALGNYEFDEQLRSDPAYFAYYCSNGNLNPRLPSPLILHENRRLVHHISSSGNNWRSTSVDEVGNGTLHFSRSSLSTHKEEPEEGRSPRLDSRTKHTGAVLSEQRTASLVMRHKSLVDLIQEDFPRTPSPVYNQSRPSNHATAEEPIDHDVQAIALDVSSMNISEVPQSNGSADVCMDTCAMGMHDISLISSNDPSPASFSSSPCPEGTGTSLSSQIDDTNSNNAGLPDDASVTGVPQSDVSKVEFGMRKKQEEQQYHGRIMLQQHPSVQLGIQYQVQGVQAQTVSQGMNFRHGGMDKHIHGHAKFSTFEGQPPTHSPGLNPPLYATAAAYMPSGNPFYPNFQPSGLYAPQYNVGGYAMNSALFPQFVAGYPSHGPVPLPFDATSGPSFNIQTTGVSTGENIPHVGDPQHQKFYGPQGLMLQTSFVDPLHMQYFQHPFGDVYSASLQQARFASGGVTGAQVDSSTRKEPTVASYMGDPKLQSLTNGNLSISNPRKVGMPIGGYHGGPPSMGFMAHFPGSPIASPVLPSPVGGTSQLGRQNEMRLPQDSSRNTGIYSGWPRQREVNIFDDPKRHLFLEELKSSSAQNFELSDIAGRIVEFSVDQHGSRFIQQKLEHCSVDEKASVFKEFLPHASKLMTDVFGNYVIQKFFEHGSPEQRKELADKLVGQMLPLSLQMYGCRVIQKALEVIELNQKTQLILELDGHVTRCVRDQNGNHVIQKCIECVPTEKTGFIFSSFRGQVATLSTHPYGCRVIQRVLENCSDEQQGQCIVDEILESADVLAQDQYGNYVTQHVLERGKPHERSQIIGKLTGKIVQMSQHKYASNVVEKCLEYGDTAEREVLTDEILGQSEDNDNLLIMMKDQYANYVVQKILERCSDKQREELISRIRGHCDALKKYTYGKHIVARFEQLYGEESLDSEISEELLNEIAIHYN